MPVRGERQTFDPVPIGSRGGRANLQMQQDLTPAAALHTLADSLAEALTALRQIIGAMRTLHERAGSEPAMAQTSRVLQDNLSSATAMRHDLSVLRRVINESERNMWTAADVLSAMDIAQRAGDGNPPPCTDVAEEQTRHRHVTTACAASITSQVDTQRRARDSRWPELPVIQGKGRWAGRPPQCAGFIALCYINAVAHVCVCEKRRGPLCFPKGGLKKEWGEAVLDGAKREWLEEAGLSLH